MLVLALTDTGAALPTRSNACGADSMFSPVPVYVRVTVTKSADTAAATSLLLIAQAVATRVRAALGAPVDSVPRADGLFAVPSPTADSVGAADSRFAGPDSASMLRVVARRDGTLRWALVRAPSSRAGALLDQALAAAKEANEAFIPSEVFAADSMPFTLGYHRAFDTVGGRVRARADGPVTLVAFIMRTGPERQAATVPGTVLPRYPTGERSGAFGAVVRLSFVVDTNGRAVASSVRDVWPAGRPRLGGEMGEHYRSFVHEATEAVTRGRFYPAELAGCRVRQLVEMPFTFTMTR